MTASASRAVMSLMLRMASSLPGITKSTRSGSQFVSVMAMTGMASFFASCTAIVSFAGSMTKTNELGVVASIPIPEVIRNIDSFTLGAQSVNPKVETRVVWVNKWFDPPKEGEAAQSLIDQGIDVLMQNTDSSAVLQTAEKDGKYAFGWDSDMSKSGPKAHLASAIINWAPYYKKAIGDALDGKWETGQSWWGVKEGAIDLVSLADSVPAETKQRIETVKAGLKDGTFVIWKGAITDASGKEVLKAGDSADDKFLHGINFYVKGVQGKLPS